MTHLRPILLVSVLLSLGGLAFACGGDDEEGPDNTDNTAGDELVHGLTKAQAAEVLVKIGDEEITVGEFAERLADQSPYLRARYNTPERRREFLNNMIRFELLAQEAEREGLDELPEVVRTRKQVMIQQMMKELFEDRIRLSDVSDEEVREYYEQRAAEFNKPAQVRASHIFIKNRATAEQVLRQVLAAPDDMANFRRLAQRYDEDPETNAGTRRGDLRFFGIDGTRNGDPDDPDRVPVAVAEAAFQIENIGDVFEGLVEADGGFHIIKLTGRRAALHRTLEEARRPIKNRLWRTKRENSVEEFVAQLREDANVEVNQAALQSVQIDLEGADDSTGPLEIPRELLTPDGMRAMPAVPMTEAPRMTPMTPMTAMTAPMTTAMTAAAMTEAAMTAMEGE